MQSFCIKCFNKGLPNRCPLCFKKKQGRGKSLEEERETTLLAKIEELQEQVTSELFYENRRKYMELLKEIRRLENLLFQ